MFAIILALHPVTYLTLIPPGVVEICCARRRVQNDTKIARFEGVCGPVWGAPVDSTPPPDSP